MGGYVLYQPPLLDPGRRSLLESGADFLSFGWHFTRQAWLKHSHDWPGAGRERLLAFWYRPGYRDYADLRNKSLLELGREYGKVSLDSRSADLYLQAHRDDPGNRWLSHKVGGRLCELKDWEKLEIVARDILKDYPGDEEGRRWLTQAEEKIIDR